MFHGSRKPTLFREPFFNQKNGQKQAHSHPKNKAGAPGAVTPAPSHERTRSTYSPSETNSHDGLHEAGALLRAPPLPIIQMRSEQRSQLTFFQKSPRQHHAHGGPSFYHVTKHLLASAITEPFARILQTVINYRIIQKHTRHSILHSAFCIQLCIVHCALCID